MTTDLWRPSAALSTLQQRATILSAVRAFMAAREILEVETPLLASHSVTDPHMPVITADNPKGNASRYYLQTSPEYSMKRLLAAGSGAIFQLCKAFRQGEVGSRHNPEFTMLEWYRPGLDHHQLMDEVEALVSGVLNGDQPFHRLSYQQLFEHHFDIDPHQVNVECIKTIAKQCLDIQMESDVKSDWLNLLLAEVIEPTLGVECPVFVYDYPSDQAALAQVHTDAAGVQVAQRFELYANGVELANGYHELLDVEDMKQRFDDDREARKQTDLPLIADDEFLLAAMQNGLPQCSGVALGFDRLVMLATGARSIDEVLTFSVLRA